VLAGPAAESREDKHNVELTLTKWNTINPGGARTEGIVRGDVSGTFAGQALVKLASDLVGEIPAATGDVTLIDSVFEVTAGQFRGHDHYSAGLREVRLRTIRTALFGFRDRALCDFRTGWIHTCTPASTATR
jgi:hypothetical protein